MEERAKANIIIEDRSKLIATGVIDVDSFDNESAILLTELGALFVKGSNFRINKLNVDVGELVIEGEIDSCVYSESYAHKKQGSFLSRMFK
ncbi:MAG: sporulation protein YabP [Eubacteriales bacterium]|jgi:sporulation protein YabP|nr:sporulation protein YabP [Eubacteriales bacterium]